MEWLRGGGGLGEDVLGRDGHRSADGRRARVVPPLWTRPLREMNHRAVVGGGGSFNFPDSPVEPRTLTPSEDDADI